MNLICVVWFTEIDYIFLQSSYYMVSKMSNCTHPSLERVNRELCRGGGTLISSSSSTLPLPRHSSPLPARLMWSRLSSCRFGLDAPSGCLSDDILRVLQLFSYSLLYINYFFLGIGLKRPHTSTEAYCVPRIHYLGKPMPVPFARYRSYFPITASDSSPRCWQPNRVLLLAPSLSQFSIMCLAVFVD